MGGTRDIALSPRNRPHHETISAVVVSAERLEALMANKDKGGRSTRKVAAKNLKQKRLDKKAKKNAGKQDRIV